MVVANDFLVKLYDQLDQKTQESQQGGWPAEYINRDTGKPYKPHHADEARFVYDDNTYRYGAALGGEGGGKALTLDTPLPTPTGWTTMGQVQAGDLLLDEQGEPCQVLATSEVMHGHDCYVVTFDDGQSIVADAGHLWLTDDSLSRRAEARQGEKYVNGTKAHLSQCQRLYYPKVRTTEQIKQTLLDRRGFTNHSITLTKPLDLPPADLPIEPYLLGVWLGDGTSRSTQITIGESDQEEMLPLIEQAGYSVVSLAHSSLQFAVDSNNSAIRDAATGRIQTNYDSFFGKLKSLDLIQNKHIPAAYLRGNFEQRLSLLQGLMDTDGTITPARGKAEYCTTSSVLADGFHDLCASLGMKVSKRKGTVKYNGDIKVRYRFSWTPYIPVFRLPRKLEHIKPAGRHSVRQFRRYITSVVPTPSVPVKCVSVSSKSKLFLAGRGMIPTHNSVAGIIKDLERLRRGMDGIMVCVAPETVIGGVPIAERTKPMPVNTLYGLRMATASYLKGKADLFRVVTQSGQAVTVTSGHHFLTPTGWRPLRSLRVGDAIAVDDTGRGLTESQIWQDYQDGYCEDCRPCDEWPTPWGQHGLDRRRPPAWLARSFSLSHRINGKSLGSRTFGEVVRLYPSLCHPSIFPPVASDNLRVHCNAKYTTIKSITFQRFGDYYDLTVPGAGHYSAHGLWHHNSPNLPHFKRSLWVEFARWCPWDQVVPHQQKRGNPSWEPYQTFILTFKNGAHLYCGGIEEPIAWEGPNVSFAHFDEARRAPDNGAVKVFDGRVRIDGRGLPVSASTLKWIKFFALNLKSKKGRKETPQLWVTTTPAKHWLFDMFGPTRLRCKRCNFADPDQFTQPVNVYQPLDLTGEKCPQCGSEDIYVDDDYAAFKRSSYAIRLFTKDNEGNLTEGYVEARAQSLSDKEKVVLLEGGWADLDEAGRFLPDIEAWRSGCFRSDLPEARLSPESDRYQAPPKPVDAPDDWKPEKPERELMIVAADAGAKDDHFAVVMGSVLLLPIPDDPERLQRTLVLRYAEEWIPPAQGVLDFQGTEESPGPERRIKMLCQDYDVALITFDPSQLLDMMNRLARETRERDGQEVPLANFMEFSQGTRRIKADTLLKQAIGQREIAHDGSFPIVESHLGNAFEARDRYQRTVRIIKQSPGSRRKIDVAVALSMMGHAALSEEKIELPKPKNKKIRFMSV